jgi:hypothetical protein
MTIPSNFAHMGIETEPIYGRPTHIRAIRAATLSAVVAVAILRVWYCLLLRSTPATRCGTYAGITSVARISVTHFP